ncbi:hypothetical protein IU421_30320 [Nocardia cyriacigeorgica]|uniref:hypothetical protein n=1 Tax=Nocardia cyriacigeorgica TaxID=135487 RepID=UPI001895FB5A|nr:hypothetical protein [Nocardia cyriacigeorgica]MBF6163053.1 hypothetical protein [Nocardia cyriacigeorgica]MBF6202021.1 hypothetical protein [Nocardia cyriacigeorgica]MBF6518543.1 hypothetical protein [Nocardia cyriacigeorgica]
MPAQRSNPALDKAYANTSGPVAYLDETFQAPGTKDPAFYVFTAVLVEREEMQDLRDKLRELAGGTFWHTTDELLTGEGWKKALAMLEYLGQGPELCVLAHECEVDDADTDVEKARRACLRGLLAALSEGGPSWGRTDLVVFEERNPRNRANFDRKHVTELRREEKIHRGMQIQMVSPKHEHLLWLPDVVSSAFRKSLTRRGEERLLEPVHARMHFVAPLP